MHSSVEFSLDYMGLSIYRTGFRALEGSLEFDAARPAASSVNASIPVAGVDVTNDRLTSRLMGLPGGDGHRSARLRGDLERGHGYGRRVPLIAATSP